MVLKQEGFTVLTYDDRTVGRLFATQTRRVDCAQFQSAAMLETLSKAHVPLRHDQLPDGARVLAGGGRDDLLLEVDCHGRTQSLDLAPAWLHERPNAPCPELAHVQADLRRLPETGQSSPTQTPPGSDLACNPAGAEAFDYPSLVLGSAQSAYAAADLEVPPVPPDWVVARVRHGLAPLRDLAKDLSKDAARQLHSHSSIFNRTPAS